MIDDHIANVYVGNVVHRHLPDFTDQYRRLEWLELCGPYNGPGMSAEWSISISVMCDETVCASVVWSLAVTVVLVRGQWRQ